MALRSDGWGAGLVLVLIAGAILMVLAAHASCDDACWACFSGKVWFELALSAGTLGVLAAGGYFAFRSC